MGASGSLLRAVGSSSAARYALTPTARALMVTEAAGIRLLDLAGDQQARVLSLVGDEGSEEETLPLSCFLIDPRPHQLPLLAADEASTEEMQLTLLAADEASAEELQARSRYFVAPRPHQITFLAAAEASEEEFLPRTCYFVAPRPHQVTFLAAEKASEEEFLPRTCYLITPRPHQVTLLAAGSRSYYIAPRPHQITLLPADEAPEVEIQPSSRARSATATVSPSFATGLGPRPRLFLPAICTGYGPPGHHLLRPAGSLMSLRSKTGLPVVLTSGLRSWAKPQRLIELPSFQAIQRRGWCWTPWQPNRPDAPETKPKGLEDIVKLLKEVKLSKEELAKLKELFLDMFYNNENPQSSDVKLDLLLHGQALTNKILTQLYGKAEKKPKKWLTFTIRGRKIDLATWIPTFISFFLK